MLTLLLVPAMLALLPSSRALPTTKVVNREKDEAKVCTTKLGEQCAFPFTYGGLEHSACTMTDSPVPWCAVARETNGTVTQNRWGDCDVSPVSPCQVEPAQLPSCSTIARPEGTVADTRVVNRPELGPAKSGSQCVFPFRYKDVTYTSCTTEDRSTAWCATATDPSGAALPGRWGYCPASCPSTCRPGTVWAPSSCSTCVCGPEGEPVCSSSTCSLPSASRCRAEAGPDKGSACVLPFSFQGKVFTSCTPWTFGGEHQGELWCSTKTSALGVHRDGGGHYGFCSPGCGAGLARPAGGRDRLEGQKNTNIVFQNTLELLDYPN